MHERSAAEGHQWFSTEIGLQRSIKEEVVRQDSWENLLQSGKIHFIQNGIGHSRPPLRYSYAIVEFRFVNELLLPSQDSKLFFKIASSAFGFLES